MTEEQKQECLRLYHAGVMIKNIHTMVGVTDAQAKRYIYKVEKLRKRNMSHSTAILATIKRLRWQGNKGKDIEAIIGMSRNQIQYLMDQVGTNYREIDNSNQKYCKK
jgi:hypothetical protein